LLGRAEGNGKLAEARSRDALAMAREVGAPQLQLAIIGLLGMLAIERGDYRSGVRLAARSDPGPAGGWWDIPDERQANEQSLTAARAALGEAGFAQEWATGQAMTLEQAIAYALEEDNG
jgi:hypothetical protein